MVEFNSTDIVHLLNQTLTAQQEQSQAHQQDMQTYLILGIVSSAMSMMIYVLLFGKPMITALTLQIKAKRLIKQYAAKTGRGVIIMTHAQTGLFGSMITMTDALKIERLLRKFRAANKEVDFIINTFGGDLFASIRIAHMIKDTPGMRVIVPKYAWSGGSLISLAAPKLMANKTSIFGAVDPQLGTLFTQFSAKAWKHIVEVKNEELKNGATSGAKDETIAMAETSEHLMKEMEGYLNDLISNKPGINKQLFFDYFLHGEHTHGNILSPNDLKTCGIEVDTLDTDIPDKVIERMYNMSGVFGYAEGVNMRSDD